MPLTWRESTHYAADLNETTWESQKLMLDWMWRQLQARSQDPRESSRLTDEEWAVAPTDLPT